MTKTMTIAVPNSLLLIAGPDGGDIPQEIVGLLTATSSCVAVGTLAQPDGQTHVTLTDDEACPRSDPTLHIEYQGELVVSQREVAVLTVTLRKLLTLHVSQTRCSVAVWTNDTREPNRVCVVVRSLAQDRLC